MVKGGLFFFFFHWRVVIGLNSVIASDRSMKYTTDSEPTESYMSRKASGAFGLKRHLNGPDVPTTLNAVAI